MAQTLIVRLPALATAETEWVAIDSTGAPIAAVQRGPLASAAQAAAGLGVVVLAPATEVLLAAPVLPPGNSVKLARAMPFALEEQLSEDVDRLHFAIGPRAADGATAVAVVARDTLGGWIRTLEAAGLAPRTMVADTAWMPENPGHTVLWLEGERLAVRRPQAPPFVVEATPLTAAFEAAGLIGEPPADAEPRALESAILHLTPQDWERVRDDVEGLLPRFETLRVQLLPDGPLPWLARGRDARDAVNLLQGDFARKPAYVDRWREWRVAAFLAIALLGVHVATEAARIHVADRESARADRAIATLYAAAMPGVPMREPRAQMEARLRAIRASAAGPSAFLRTMQALGTAIGEAAPTRLESFAFHQGTWDLTVSTKSVDALGRLSQALAQQGLRAEIQSSTPASGGVEAHLRIRAAGGAAR